MRKHTTFRYRKTRKGYSLLWRGRVIHRSPWFDGMQHFAVGWAGGGTYSILPEKGDGS